MSELPETPKDSVRRSLETLTKTREAVLQSAGFRDIEDLSRKTKLLSNMVKPSTDLTESIQKLTQMRIDLRPSIDPKVVETMLGPSIERPKIAPLPPHPAHVTNQKLGELNAEVEALRKTQTEMISVLQTMVTVQMRTDRKTTWIILLSAIAIVVAILLGTRVL